MDGVTLRKTLGTESARDARPIGRLNRLVPAQSENQSAGSIAEVFRAFLRLGLTSFGGPAAHIGYFHDEFVKRRRWLDETAYADLVALCQFLPGPASSQLGFALGRLRAGWPGALAAWAAFTLPSAAAMIAAALGFARWQATGSEPWLHGLKLAAVAVVTHAVWTMARKLSVGRLHFWLTVAASVLVLVWQTPAAQIVALGLAAIVASKWSTEPIDGMASPVPTNAPMAIGAAPLILFGALLVGLPLLAAGLPNPELQLFDRFYRAGALVFGGGHVVLPLLQSAVASPGLVSQDSFLAGYGLAQALPGPLFTFAGYLGATAHAGSGAWFAGLAALVAIFLPGLLLVAGVLPAWDRWRASKRLRAALNGANAAVVGMLLAALIDPIAMTTLHRTGDWLIALGAVGLLWKRLPSWAVVALCAAAGWGLGR
jgi:chromate transporter